MLRLLLVKQTAFAYTINKTTNKIKTNDIQIEIKYLYMNEYDDGK